MAQKRLINGLDVNLLIDTMSDLKKKPQCARFRFRATNDWIDGAHGQTTIKDYYGPDSEVTYRPKAFVLEGDEPEVLLGTDKGPNATEALLHALASCLNTTFIYHASARGIKIDKLELSLEGTIDIRGFLGLDEGVRNGFNSINVTVRIKSDAPVEKLKELCRLAEKHSPVFDIVTNPVPVELKIEIDQPITVAT